MRLGHEKHRVPRSFLKSISVCKSPKAFLQLSPIDIATGALNNRISSVWQLNCEASQGRAL